MREKHCLQKTHFSTAFLVTNQSLNVNSNYMSNCLTNELYWQEIKTNLKVNHEKGNTTNYNTIVLLHTHRRRTRGCSRCTCTPTFIQSPKFYIIKCCIGENSPKFSGNAPALFRALRRQ